MIELSTFGEHALIRVSGPVDEAMAPGLRDALTWATRHHTGVVIDLAGAPTIDATGLGLLVRAHRRAHHRGGVVCLVQPSRFLLTVLHTMRVDGVFPVFPDSLSAQDWLRHGDSASIPEAAGALRRT